MGVIRWRTGSQPACLLPTLRWPLSHLLQSTKPPKVKNVTSMFPSVHSVMSLKCIQMDPRRVSAVADWTVPTNRKQRKRVLGFTNSHKWLSRDCSTDAASPVRSNPFASEVAVVSSSGSHLTRLWLSPTPRKLISEMSLWTKLQPLGLRFSHSFPPETNKDVGSYYLFFSVLSNSHILYILFVHIGKV